MARPACFLRSIKIRALLTGGAGFIGSHIADCLLARGHEVAVDDDLATGKRSNAFEADLFEMDIRCWCEEVFKDFEPGALCHQAAQTNVVLLQNCIEYGVRRVVFASTGRALYGEQREFPAILICR